MSDNQSIMSDNSDNQSIISTKGKNHGRNSKRWNRKSKTKIVLFNEFMFNNIMYQLRQLSVGPKFILQMRFVCKDWSKWILNLEKWVWRYWTKDYIRFFSEKFNRPRYAFSDNIMRIRKAYLNQDWLVESKKIIQQKKSPKGIVLIEMKINYKKVGQMNLLKTIIRKRKRSKALNERKCNKCNNKGQGFSKVCFYCPNLLKRRILRNLKKKTKKLSPDK